MRLKKALKTRQHSRQPLGTPSLVDDLGAEQQEHQIFGGPEPYGHFSEGGVNQDDTLHHLYGEATVVFLHLAIIMLRSMGMVMNGLLRLPRLPVERDIR